MADDKKNHWSFLANLLGAEGAAPEPTDPAPASDSEEPKAETPVAPPSPSADKPKPPAKKSTPGWGDLAKSFGLASTEEVAPPVEQVIEESAPEVAPEPEQSDDLGWNLDDETLPSVLPGFGTPKARTHLDDTAPSSSDVEDSSSPGDGDTSFAAAADEPQTTDSAPQATLSESTADSVNTAEQRDREDRPRRRSRRGRGDRNREDTDSQRPAESRSRRDDREPDSDEPPRSEFDFEPSSRDEGEEGDDERRPRRRRRRRRRRGEENETVRSQEADDSGESGADTTEIKGDDSEGDAPESGEGRPRRRRRGRRRSESPKQETEVREDADEDVDVEGTEFGFADDDGGEDRKPRRSRGRDGRQSGKDAVPEEVEAGTGERQKRRQQFTSWSEAIGHVIDRNLATRSESGGGRGNGRRGRGGRGRRSDS